MFLFSLFWSLIILLAFWGYGEALRRAINKQEFNNIGWGLTMAWGLSVSLAMGGVLLMLSLAKTYVLCAHIAVGALTAIYFIIFNKLKSKGVLSDLGKDSKIQPTDCLIWLLVVLSFLCSISWPHQIDPNDDILCYFTFAERILQTGTLIEPFNFRRIGTLGGHAFLQALTMIGGGDRAGHIADSGFGLLIWFGILWQIVKKSNNEVGWVRFFFLFAVLFIPVPRINTMSSLTGVAMLVAFFETLNLWKGSKDISFKSIIPLGLILGAVDTLRPTFTVLATLFFTFYVFLNIYQQSIQSKINNNSKIFYYLYLKVAVISLLMITPWSTVLYFSNGTIHFPPFSGNFNPEFASIGSKKGLIYDLFNSLAFLFTPEVLVIISCYLSAILLYDRNIAYSLSLAAVLSSLIVAFKFGVTNYFELYRYTFPILIAGGTFLMAKAIQSLEELKKTSGSNLFLIVIPCLLLFCTNSSSGSQEWMLRIQSISNQLSFDSPMIDKNFKLAYEFLQNKVPAGEPILAAVDAPYLLDYSRNEIFNIDAIGGASPWGGLPYFKGADSLKKYLIKNQVNYILAVEFDKGLLMYTRKHWTDPIRQEWYFKEIYSKYSLDFMDSVDELAKTNQVVAVAGNARLIKLK